MASPLSGPSSSTALSTDPNSTPQTGTHTKIQRQSAPAWVRIALLLALLAAFALRLLLLNTWPLREDESLYAFWARTFWSDPRYLHTFPDKPPVFLWLQAVALALFGPTAPGARLLSIFASTATVAVVAAGAKRLWHSAPSSSAIPMVAATWLLALNPFAIAFAPTGYTDSLLVLFGAAAIVQCLRGRFLWAGILTAAAIMTKQQGLFYLPLMLVLALVVAVDAAPGQRTRLRALGSLLGGLAIVLLPIFIWDASRWTVAPSPWDAGAQNYAPIAIAALNTLSARSQDWLALLWFGAATPWAWLLLSALAILALVAYCSTYRRGDAVLRWAFPLLALWILAFLATHLFLTIAPWDRYLLPIFPPAGNAARRRRGMAGDAPRFVGSQSPPRSVDGWDCRRGITNPPAPRPDERTRRTAHRRRPW